MHIMFWIDLNAPDAADVLTEEPRELKTDGAWSPYESKMVSIESLTLQPMNKHMFPSVIDVPPRHP